MTEKQAKHYYAKVATDSIRVDALIVPGLAFKEKNWSTLMKRRVIWSWILYKQGICRHVIYSGAAVYTPFREASIMGLYAEQLGIPKEAIFYDTVAEHSTENVYYSYLVAKQLHFKSVALGTDIYQSGFLKRFTRRKFKSPVFLIPVIKDSIKQYENIELQIDTCRAMVGNPTGFKTIRQRQSPRKRLQGTLGRNIPWYLYKDAVVPAL